MVVASSSPLDPIFAGAREIPYAFREQFLLSPDAGHDVVLEGVMDEISFPVLLTPVFRVLGRLGMLVPRRGVNVPASLHVIPRRLADGSPTHEYMRRFEFAIPVRFDTTIVWDQRHNNLADLVGRPRMLRMVWDARFTPPGLFTMRSIAHAITLRGHVIWLPRWMWKLCFGTADFRQQADPIDENLVSVDLRIRHVFGLTVFRYRGRFRTRRIPTVRQEMVE